MSEEVKNELDFVFGPPEDTEITVETKPQNGVNYSDPGWNDYVMSLFEQSELYNGKYPTLNGMRRVAEKLLGQVIVSEIQELKSSLDHSSNGRAYCVYKITINNFLGSYQCRSYCGAAGSFEGNTHKDYSIYPEAIAEGRAEARAYRKALLLKTAAAEEIKGNEKSFESVIPSVKEDYDENDKMSETQDITIKKKCQQVKVDKDKLFASYKETNKKEELTKQDAVNLMKLLSEYHNDGSKIPGEIKL